MLQRQLVRTARLVARSQGHALYSSAASGNAAAAAGAGGFSLRPYLNFKNWKENIEETERNTANRNVTANIRKTVELYTQHCELTQKAQTARAEKNRLSQRMKEAKGKEERDQLINESRAIKDLIADVEAKLVQVEEGMFEEGVKIPNSTHPDVPIGDESRSAVLKVVGSKRDFDFPVRNHLDIGEKNDWVDFHAGSEVSGSNFYFLKGPLALLELALIQYSMQKAVARGFVPVIPPDVVRLHVAEGCGFQPRDDTATQVYRLDKRHSSGHGDLCLAGTAEIPLTGMYMNNIIAEEKLPIKMVAVGHAFRVEAGSAGTATRGLYRVHQFTKVELFAITAGDLATSCTAMEEILALQVEMFTELGLHFKVLDMASHDLGAPAYRKYDVEAWMPGRGSYGEISSTSNCTDFQSRRLNIKYREKKSAQNHFVHTLNGTACAVPRMILALVENGQQADGSVIIPPALRPFMGGMERLV